MRTSKFFISTLKESPGDAEIISQQLMVRSGMIKKLAAGIYTWMPLGLRVLAKVEQIIRQEMNIAGAVELLMPAVQPAELWQESGRWQHYGPELLRLKDRHQRDFVIGPTHEEVITDVVRREIKSYRQLPLNFYQIQTKFRDEIRPRFGVMRGREFIMKDAYSFHSSFEDLQREYQNMFQAYHRIFSRLGLSFRAVAADTGSIGGSGSHEFHVIATIGEDAIAWCPDSDYAANVELAETLKPAAPVGVGLQPLRKIATAEAKSCEHVAAFLQVPLTDIVKSIAVMTCPETAEVKEPKEKAESKQGTEQSASAEKPEFVLILMRADHTLNEIKLAKLLNSPYRFAENSEIEQYLGCPAGNIGPIGVDQAQVKILADYSVAAMVNFVCGANEPGFHWQGANFERDCPLGDAHYADLRNIVAGDPSPDGRGTIEICRGIEVGHIFQLRTKYSAALRCSYIDEKGQTLPMEMGCYGIGVTRVIAAAIEQNHDQHGIIFPKSMAPFVLCIVPMGYHKDPEVKRVSDELYAQLRAQNYDVLLDDRDERPGVLLADMELIGVPHRLVIGARALKNNQIEYRARTESESTLVDLNEVFSFLSQKELVE